MICKNSRKYIFTCYNSIFKSYFSNSLLHNSPQIYNLFIFFTDNIYILDKSWSGADAINISGLLNPKKLGNFKNWML